MSSSNFHLKFDSIVQVLLVCTLLAAATGTSLFAQNSTSSPYSIFGIGEIETRDFGRTTGMGNVGIGVCATNFLNRTNPAGLSAIDTLTFILDFAGAVKIADYRTSSQNGRTTDFNFKNLAVGFRLTKWWTTSVGISPYSNVGYNMVSTQMVEGADIPFNTTFTGNGGINKFYWGNAISPLKGLSLGITASYLFGSINHREETTAMDVQYRTTLDKLYCDFGVQYTQRLGSNRTLLTVGGIYGYQSKITLGQHINVSKGDAEYLDKEKGKTTAYIPESYGAGISLLTAPGNTQWLVAFDYRYQDWSMDPSQLKGIIYCDSHQYNFGLQITPNPYRPRNYLQVMKYQLGASYNQSYLMVNGHQVNDYSVSLGVGLPFMNRSYVSVAAILGQSFTGGRGGITENYALVSVSLSLIELWFAKGKYE